MKTKNIVFSNGRKRDEYKIRSSQGMTPFGMGAIVDFKSQSLMAASTKFWDINKCRVIHDERLEKILKVDTFYLPENLENDNDYGFPFVNFPEWYFCPKCREFKPLSEWQAEYNNNVTIKHKEYFYSQPCCSKCSSSKNDMALIPARVICICSEGHIQDFPWVAWTHLRSRGKSDNKICDNPKIKIKTQGSTTGLEGIQVECTHCGAKASLQGSFSKDYFKEIIDKHKNLDIADEFRCKGNRPWELSKEQCKSDDQLIVVQRGASNIHYEKIISSIVIPPYSNKLSSKIDNHEDYKGLVKEVADIREDEEEITVEEFLNERSAKRRIERLSKEIGYDYSEVYKAIEEKLLNKEEAPYSEVKYKSEEYKALTGIIQVDDDSALDFKIKELDINQYNLEFINRVVLVERLREVRAFVGFTRGLPPDNKHFNEEDELKESLLVSTRYKNWYPAYEVRGEGIFIELDFDELRKWANKDEVIARANIINRRNMRIIKEKDRQERTIDSAFIVLHTLAHLIIKQLSFDCGYSSASLRERIYYNADDSLIKMSGILIYTASGDSEGTLGGLVRQGHPDRLDKMIVKALNNATWCSNDPVCIESVGQGRDSLNLAACYSCSLVSETSCEEFNTFLDRGLLIGTLDNPEIGYLSKYVNEDD